MTSVCDDAHTSTSKTQVKHSETCVRDVLSRSINSRTPLPWTQTVVTKLLCISSGLPTSKEVEADMLNFVEKGEEATVQFMETRLVEKSFKFHDPTKKLRLKIFESVGMKKVLRSTEKKSIQVKAERNLIGRLLMLSQENGLSLPKLFEYPLGPIPWSIATADGGMVKTNKAQLMHHLEKKSVPSACPSADKCVYVIDGNALLQSCVNLPKTFGELALQILKCLPEEPRNSFCDRLLHVQ